MSIYAIDFETFYSKEFSVTDLGYWHYVNHHSFDAYMVSIVGDDGNEFVGHPKDFDWNCIDGQVWLSHNASFDGMVYQRLVEQGIIKNSKPSVWHDTADLVAFMGLPRSLKASIGILYEVTVEKSTRDNMAGKQWDSMTPEFKKEVEEYALKDSRFCLKIWQDHGDKWPEHERKLSIHTRHMGWAGVPVDTEGVEEDIRTLELKLWEARKLIPWADDEEAKVLSPKAMAEECRKHGIEPPRSMAQDSDEFDKWKEKYSEKFPFAQAMSDYRRINALLMKMKTMRQRTKPDGRMAYGLKYFGAHTGRWSGDSGFNIQNMPRGELFGINLRKRIKAPEGKTLVVCDLSNIEPRCLAVLCEDVDTLSALRTGMDIYEAHARATMGYTDPKPLKEGNPFLRQVAKTRVLGLGYGCGWHKFVVFAGQILPPDVYESVFGQEITKDDLSKFAAVLKKRKAGNLFEEFTHLDEATQRNWVNSWKQVEAYRRDNEKITKFWKRLEDDIRKARISKHYEIELPSDRVLKYKNVMDHGGISAEVPRLGRLMRVSMHGGILTENVIQALARDVFADCLLRLDEAGIEVILHAHDEAVCLVDTDKAEEKLKQITEIMSTAPAWMKELPQAAEGKTCERYTK
jgi:DNA polymerase I-like protein with 3'-5' exonuclease and polymerase domains